MTLELHTDIRINRPVRVGVNDLIGSLDSNIVLSKSLSIWFQAKYGTMPRGRITMIVRNALQDRLDAKRII